MNQQYDTNERCLLMNIFNNLDDIYNAIYEYDNFIPYILENSGTINLWHKNFNETWKINLY